MIFRQVFYCQHALSLDRLCQITSDESFDPGTGFYLFLEKYDALKQHIMPGMPVQRHGSPDTALIAIVVVSRPFLGEVQDNHAPIQVIAISVFLRNEDKSPVKFRRCNNRPDIFLLQLSS